MGCSDIGTLDLAPVRALAKANHRDWTDAVLDDAVRRYRDFLSVCCYGVGHGSNHLAAVDALADEMWHCHMLLPVKYQSDCHTVFGSGRVLDHYPAGVNGQAPVTPIDQRAALHLYDEAGVRRPGEVRAECVWAIVDLTP
ncbi:MAG TPA: hypothetical protein VGO86_14520 [Candidatus Dormibacteraeota bacterium]|jgi:hypothetical protein